MDLRFSTIAGSDAASLRYRAQSSRALVLTSSDSAHAAATVSILWSRDSAIAANSGRESIAGNEEGRS